MRKYANSKIIQNIENWHVFLQFWSKITKIGDQNSPGPTFFTEFSEKCKKKIPASQPAIKSCDADIM